MCRLIADQVVTARKPHGCNACGGRIEKGHPYARQRVADGGEAWTWKAHLLCHAVAASLMVEYHLDCGEPVDWGEVQERVGDLLGVALGAAA